jgi:hypothetical protein
MAQTGERLDVFSEADLTYIQASYTTLDLLCRSRDIDPLPVQRLIDAGRLPRPTYVVPDGIEFFPPEYFELLDDAGEVGLMHERFGERYGAAAAAEATNATSQEIEDEWNHYLSGVYGVCLKQVTPENIFLKTWLISRIEALLQAVRCDDAAWRAQLTALVDRLDEIERPFTERDRRDGPVSRDLYVDRPRVLLQSSNVPGDD